MKRLLFIFLISLSFAFSVSAQKNEARQIDEHGIIPCGDSLSRLHWIYTELQNSPDSKIYIIYYGGKFRKETLWNEKTKSYDKILLTLPHRKDALNRAKSVPLYLTTEKAIPEAIRNSFRDRIVLINGGFQENIKIETWLVPKDSELPKPSPNVDEKDIKFRKDKPLRTPVFTKCYE